MNPHDPDPEPPEVVSPDRWRYFPLSQPIPLTERNLTKLAHSADPRTSSFAVYPDNRSGLMIWGLVDQQNRYHAFVNFDATTGPDRPGLFQLETSGVGHLRASIGYETIIELKLNRLARPRFDPMRTGPIASVLSMGVGKALKRVDRKLMRDVSIGLDGGSHWSSVWTESFCRLLNRVQGHRHGGAFLITPDRTFRGLKVKYGLKYPRIRTAIESKIYFERRAWSASEQLMEDVDADEEAVSTMFYLEETINEGDSEEARIELDGAIWFVSLLTRVDGLVLLNPDFEVLGFGVEINVSDVPGRVHLAGDAEGSQDRLRPFDYEEFGTRHRSMMRYCAKVPGSLGLVVSQDGGVRAIMSLRGGVVIWDNLNLQLEIEEYGRRRRRKAKPN